jgi:hypothetical protein
MNGRERKARELTEEIRATASKFIASAMNLYGMWLDSPAQFREATGCESFNDFAFTTFGIGPFCRWARHGRHARGIRSRTHANRTRHSQSAR